jgi:alginate O-acetyltransferase complex protein AlgI
MVFSSEIFLFIFLPFALLGYYLIRKDFRNYYLLLISLAFFAWSGINFLLILLVDILINYLFGLLLSYVKSKGIWINGIVLYVSLAANLSMLVYYKYLNLLTSTLNRLAGMELPLKEIPLLLGISFFTFSAISYLLDIYSGKIVAQKNPLDFALYMSFFPKLIQGPISRYGDIIPQIKNRDCNSAKFTEGIFRFVVGLAKKMIIADQMGVVVDQIFANPASQNSIAIAWLGAISYAMQIYFDFSGYTDMAIGLGKMFGFDLAENFNNPYISTSVTEFWRRWHITLSTWFRDYVFYPLEFKRRRTKTFRQESNTLIVFFLTGLWHGAAWHYVIWGLWHGLFISIETFLRNRKINIKLPTFIKYLLTMLILTVGWVLFRAKDLSYAAEYIGVMFGLIKSVSGGVTLFWYLTPKIATVLMVAVLACVPWKNVFPRFMKQIVGSKVELIFRDISLVILLVISIILVMTSSYNAFIYFKF